MSIEVECKVCGEEYDMRHGTCPACEWRIKRVAQLEQQLAEKERQLDLMQDNVETALKIAAEKDKDLAAMISWAADNWVLNETDFSALPPHLYRQVKALAGEKEDED